MKSPGKVNPESDAASEPALPRPRFLLFELHLRLVVKLNLITYCCTIVLSTFHRIPDGASTLDSFPMLEGTSSDRGDLSQLKWFGDVVERAGAHRLNRKLYVSLAADHDDDRVRRLNEDLANHLQSAHPGHRNIGHDQIESLRSQSCQRCFCRVNSDTVIEPAQEFNQDALNLVIVVNDKQRDFSSINGSLLHQMMSLREISGQRECHCLESRIVPFIQPGFGPTIREVDVKPF
jgi:hypothetical protein